MNTGKQRHGLATKALHLHPAGAAGPSYVVAGQAVLCLSLHLACLVPGALWWRHRVPPRDARTEGKGMTFGRQAMLRVSGPPYLVSSVHSGRPGPNVFACIPACDRQSKLFSGLMVLVLLVTPLLFTGVALATGPQAGAWARSGQDSPLPALLGALLD